MSRDSTTRRAAHGSARLGGALASGMSRFLRWFFFASLSTILLLQLRGLDAPLRTAATPLGILSFEFAVTAARAAAMLDAWRAAGALDAARVSLGVDVGFLLVYPWFFRSSVQLLAAPEPVATGFDRVGQQLAAFVLFCTPLDLAENLALWRLVETVPPASPSGALAALAGVAATVKFLLVVATGCWCLVALSRRIGRTSSRPSPRA